MMKFPFGFRTTFVFAMELVLGDPVVSVIGLEHTYVLCACCAQASLQPWSLPVVCKKHYFSKSHRRPEVGEVALPEEGEGKL